MRREKYDENCSTGLQPTSELDPSFDQNSALYLKRGLEAPRAMEQQKKASVNFEPREIEELANGVSKARALVEEAKKDTAFTIIQFLFLQLISTKSDNKRQNRNS